ncbi:MAG: cysteine--tRNA ligase [Candidatus Eisenbacteria sp.]|nr:cysteine--tRNA ligase [Candidatus Eisenbacteria bacterium]
MAFRIHDTLAARKKEFVPVNEGKVGMYFCGMTVQDEPHVGHMRAAITGDMFRRYLESKGFEVTFITNFTDVDDKIIAKANEEGVTYEEVARRNIEKYLWASDALNIRRASIYPKATEHIPEIVDLIQVLIDKGHAYQSGADVYFIVSSFADYGKLSKKKVDDLRVGARVEPGEQKRSGLDFALWKGAKEGEPYWDSPWGRGRPGWHIECSAMSMKYLGDTLDLHGGGTDLIFPHHENEIAQSEGATGKEFVRHWVQNGLVRLTGEKMSKSTGHFFAMSDILKEVDAEVLRLYLLSTHYRSAIEFSRERLAEAAEAMDRFRNLFIALDEVLGDRESLGPVNSELLGERERGLLGIVTKAHNGFGEAMDDDLNSARAIGHLYELVREANAFMAGGEVTTAGKQVLRDLENAIRSFGGILGLFGKPQEDLEVPEDIQSLVAARVEARTARNWGEADRIRDELQARGWVLEDKAGGTRIKRVR